MKTLHFIIILLLAATVALGQTKNTVRTESIVLEYNDGKEIFHICTSNPHVSINEKKSYYWYQVNSGIQKTDGGIGGSLLHGKYQLFSENGKLVKEVNYNLGLEHGLTRQWNEEGNIVETVKFRNGEMFYCNFIDSAGYTIEIAGPPFTKGTVKTVTQKYGGVIEKTTYLAPFKMHSKIYYEFPHNNRLKEECVFSLGGPEGRYYHGTYRSFFENGKPKMIGKFVENARDSTWTYYNEDGNVEAIEKYKVHRELYSNKKMKTIGSLVLAGGVWIKYGTWIYNNEKGDLDKAEDYINGELYKTW